MTPEEQAELMRFRVHCSNQQLCVWYFSLDGEISNEFHTEPIVQAG